MCIVFNGLKRRGISGSYGYGSYGYGYGNYGYGYTDGGYYVHDDKKGFLSRFKNIFRR
jgi:hypothetical protein